jgi:uncharacterized protein (TIGR03086 family)
VTDSFSTEILERAFASTRGVLGNVTPAQLDESTPCASWDVRALVNHIVGGTHYFAGSVRGDFEPSAVAPDFAAGDFMAGFDDGAAQAVAAFGAPGNAEKMITLPFATLPGATFMGIAATDSFAHGWDLARSTGQPTDLDPTLAAQLLENARVFLPDALRGPDGTAPFGPLVEARASASPADQLAAFLGRSV